MQPTQEEQDATLDTDATLEAQEAQSSEASPLAEPTVEPALAVEPEGQGTNQPAAQAPTSVSQGPSSRGYPPVSDAERPSYVFLGVVAAVSLIADIGTKVWAEMTLTARGHEPMTIIGDNMSIILAYNKGGAWGIGSTAGEMFRKPFFLGVSAFAIVFILSLYSRLHPSQKALKWGLPLVLGGALGNLSDRITRSQVIDFIDYRADWVMSLNSFVHKYYSGWALTDHWPTFNVADIAICIGVILMGIDMFSHRPRPQTGPTDTRDEAPSPPAEALTP